MSTPYLPPGATPRPGHDSAGEGPGAPSAGYRPPVQSAPGTEPASVAPAAPQAPAVSEEQPTTASVPPSPAPQARPDAASPAVTTPVPHRSRRRLLMLAGIAVLLVALVLGGAALMGLFAPKLSRLPSRVDAYVKEAPPQKATASEYDAATYRASAGDLYTAVLKKQGSDPAVAFAKASQATRFQLGDVYCTGVSKGGKGGDCSVLLETGAVLTVSGSTRHTAADVAALTAGVRNGIR